MSDKPVPTHDYTTIVYKNKQTRNATPYFITSKDRRELLEGLGDAAYILFQYYMEKSTVKGFRYNDEQAAKALGFNVHKVRRTRHTLTKKNWFLQSTYFNFLGRKIVITILGRNAVLDYIKNGQTLRYNRIS